MNPQSCQRCPSLEISTKTPGVKQWQSSQLQIGNFRMDDLRNRLTVIIAQANVIRDCASCKQHLTDTFKIPALWWTPWCKRSNGYFGCEDTLDEHGGIDGHNTWFRFLIKQTVLPNGKEYFWHKFNIFTRWHLSSKHTSVLIFDPNPTVKTNLLAALLNAARDEPIVEDPYSMHPVIIEEVVRLQDEAVWSIRTIVRDLERARPSTHAPAPDYPHLHDVARHAIHVSETLDLATKTIGDIITHHNLRNDSDLPDSVKTSQQIQIQITSPLHFLNHSIDGLRSRSSSNKERLLNEIQLSFHVVAQADSKTSVAISRAVQSDSAAMKTIAFLTLAFLPATFVSSVFSTSFFNYDPDAERWRVSGRFWVFWVVSLPITCFTVALWWIWQMRFLPRLIGEKRRRGV